MQNTNGVGESDGKRILSVGWIIPDDRGFQSAGHAASSWIVVQEPDGRGVVIPVFGGAGIDLVLEQRICIICFETGFRFF